MKVRWSQAIPVISILLLGSSVLAGDGDLIINGSVGIGTTTPVAKLDVNGNIHMASGNTFDIRDANHGITWDSGVDGPRFFGFLGVALGTTSQGYSEKMRITSSGNIGIGTSTPDARLKLESGGIALGHHLATSDIDGSRTSIQLATDTRYGGTYHDHTGALIYTTMPGEWGTSRLEIRHSTGWSTYAATPDMVIGNNVGIGTASPPGNYKLFVSGDAFSTGYWIGSDIRFKKNIEPLGDAVSLIKALKPVRFDWRTDEFVEKNFSPRRQIGFVAQDLEEVIPEMVRTDADGYKAISYEKLTTILAQAIKEQQEQIEALKMQVQQLMRR